MVNVLITIGVCVLLYIAFNTVFWIIEKLVSWFSSTEHSETSQNKGNSGSFGASNLINGVLMNVPETYDHQAGACEVDGNAICAETAEIAGAAAEGVQGFLEGATEHLGGVGEHLVQSMGDLIAGL